MHILVLPSFYPDVSNTNLGSFFKEQVKMLAAFDIRVNVVYVEHKSLRNFNFRSLKYSHFQSGLTDEILWREYRIKGWNIPGVTGKIIWIYLTNKLVKKYISENGKPDIIHAHNAFWAGIVALNIKKKFKIPFVITEHSSLFLSKNELQKIQSEAIHIFSEASGIIAVSQSLRNAIKKIKPFEIDVIPNIVDIDLFKPDVQKSNVNGNIRFLAIGYLNKNKGHDLLIEAFSKVSDSNQNVTLDICGEGPEKNSLLKKIQELNLGNKVIISGHQNKVQILKKLQESDCLVHTSYFETFGVVLIEAMSCGVPFITTKCGGPEDIIEEGVGYMVDPGNASMLAEAMFKFIDNKNEFSKFNIRSIAVNKYSYPVVAEKIMQIYSRVINACN